MDEQKLTYEQFKEDILQWKNTHREEYNRFSRLMTNGDERQYLAICKAIFRQLPGIRREWELSWNDDSTDGLANINMQFAENAVPGQIVELYRKQREENNPLPDNVPPVTFWGRIKSFFSGKSSKPGVTLSAPLVLSWLYYGKSFEAMVSMIEKQMKNPKADNADRLGCSLVVKQIINVSIRNGFRTRADWDRYFAMNNAIEKAMSANGPCRPSRLTWKPMKKAGIRLQPGPKTASGGLLYNAWPERKKSRNGHSPIILITRTRKLYYIISATLFPSIQVPFIRHYRSMY